MSMMVFSIDALLSNESDSISTEEQIYENGSMELAFPIEQFFQKFDSVAPHRDKNNYRCKSR